MASTVLSEKEEKKKREAREFASAVLTGTVIGRSLHDALRLLSREDEDAGDLEAAAVRVRARSHDSKDAADTHAGSENGSDSDSDSNSDSTRPPVHEVRKPQQQQPIVVTMNDGTKTLNKILQSFKEGVAESQIFHYPEKDGAPRALLKGRCDCYNRYGQNWMVAMDTVKLKARPTKFTKRRRDDRPSLWDRDNYNNDGVEGKNTKNEIMLNEKIELLAYGDIA